jgi:hypothetical protein
MELTGTQVAATTRMRERSIPSSPVSQPALAEPQKAPPRSEANKPTEVEELDKYDISTLACTD